MFEATLQNRLMASQIRNLANFNDEEIDANSDNNRVSLTNLEGSYYKRLYY